MWINLVRINDKALTVVTGLILLLGVGTLAHKGDEFFAPKTAHVEIAKADLSRSDALPSTFNPTPDKLSSSYSIPVKTTSEIEDIPNFTLARNETSPATTALNGSSEVQSIVLDCDLSLGAKPLRGARILLEISAPCHKKETVLISHAGLRFNEIIGEKGMISIIIPVLSNPANIDVSFSDGVSKSISTVTKDLSTLQRTGIAWSGQSDLQLHAQEVSFDANRNTQITHRNNRTYMQSYMQGGGYITTLGNKNIEGGNFIQIYSIDSPNDIFVDFTIALTPTYNRCGSAVKIKTMRYTAALGTKITDKNVVIRDCSAKSETIVLNNFLRNLKVAQRN